MVIGVPDVVRNKAMAVGAGPWLDELPALVAECERAWSIEVGPALTGGTEAYVAEATQADGTPAVLKLLVPRDREAARHEITVLRLAAGEGCVRLLHDDEAKGALLLERLGRSLHELSLPIDRRLEVLCSAAERAWRPAPGCGLPTGAEKGRWLADFIADTWEALDHPCTARAVEDALACAERRIAAHDDERAVLVQTCTSGTRSSRATGSPWSTPTACSPTLPTTWRILMREDPLELLAGDAHERARWLAGRTGLDATAIWEWGVVERVSTGLVCTQVDLQPAGREMLAVADRVAP